MSLAICDTPRSGGIRRRALCVVLLALGFVLLLGLLASSCQSPGILHEGAIDGVVELRSADYLAVDVATPPTASDPGWRAVDLPHRWRPGPHRGAWYRVRVRLAETPAEVQGVYLPRLHMNAAVYLNHAFIGDGGRMEDPMARNWNTPLYFTVPPPLFVPGENELLIRLRSNPGEGLFPSVQLGPERILKPRFELRRFLQCEVTALLSMGLVGLALFEFGLWWRRRQDSVYLWLAGASLLWALFSAYLFVSRPVSWGAAFQWFSHSCLDLWAVAFMGFVHRFAGVKRPRLERTLLLLVLGLVVLTASISHAPTRTATFRLCHTVSLGIIFYLGFFVFRAWWRHRSTELGLLMLALGFLLLAVTHDWLAYTLFMWLQREPLRYAIAHMFLFHHYAAPLVIMALAWHLSRRFVSALDEAELLNTELERRVEQGRLELEQSFAERRILWRDQAASEAQERIYRDLHDDLGAKLLTLVIGADDPRHAELARSALQDLREVVSHSAHRQGALLEHLADWRSETMSRLSEAQVELRWQEDPDLPELMLPAEVALNLRRILREAVSNILRHACASKVDIRIAVQDDELLLRVVDDGVGVRAGTSPGSTQGQREGRGLRNLRTRAGQLGGQLSVGAAQPRGFQLELLIPLVRLTQLPHAAATRTAEDVR